MNKVTEEQVNNILKNAEVRAETKFDKVTVVTVKLPNGFVLTESSGAVSKENYDIEIGKRTCLARIKNKIWELEGYALATDMQMSDRFLTPYQELNHAIVKYNERALTKWQKMTVFDEPLFTQELMNLSAGLPAQFVADAMEQTAKFIRLQKVVGTMKNAE